MRRKPTLPTIRTDWLLVLTGEVEPTIAAGPFTGTDKQRDAKMRAAVLDELRWNDELLHASGHDSCFWVRTIQRPGLPMEMTSGAFQAGWMDDLRALVTGKKGAAEAPPA